MSATSLSTEHVNLKVADGTEMRAYVARPKDGARHPGLLVFQEAFGVNAHIRSVADRFAAKGFVAIAPELFHRTAPPGFEAGYDNFAAIMPHFQAVMNEQNSAADIRAAYEWLAKNPGTENSAIASVGFCLGGTISFAANAIVPLKAAISFYGGGIAPNPRSPGLLSKAPDLHAPMLLLWGGADQHIPPEQAGAVADALKKAGKLFVNVEFSDAGHGFFCDARGSYNPAAAAEAWALCNAFLSAYLGTEKAAGA